MQIVEFIDRLNLIAPPEFAEDFDEGRIGLIVEGKNEITKVACALDATYNTVSQAVDIGADILIVHHPPIWDPLRQISGSKMRLLKTALAADLNIFAMHTNYDHAHYGINYALGELLGLKNIEMLSLGVIGICDLTYPEIAKKLGGGLRLFGKEPHTPYRLAIVGGSGFDLELLEEAADAGADIFLSSELKHSVLLESPLPLLESTHYALEAVGMETLAEKYDWTFIPDRPLEKIYSAD